MEASLPPVLGTDNDTCAANGWMQLLEASLHCCLWKPDMAVVCPSPSPEYILSEAVNVIGTTYDMSSCPVCNGGADSKQEHCFAASLEGIDSAS